MAVQTAGLNKNVEAFLNLLQYTEGTALYKNPYNVLVGGKTFTDFSRHPNVYNKALDSTAAGAYQMINKTFKNLGLKNFTPEEQDQGAIKLIKGRNAYNDVLAGNWETAIRKCAPEWASLPLGRYKQPHKSLESCLSFLNKYVGTTPTKKKYFNTNPVVNIFGHFYTFIFGL